MVMLSESVRAGITIPDLSTTEIFLAASLVFIIISAGRKHSAAKRTGVMKVIRRKLFFLTRVMYSRLITRRIVLKFILNPPLLLQV